MKPVTVMIVDDQKLFRDGLRTVLTGQAGVQVVAEACNGEQALSQNRQWLPRVVLMDLRMPVMNGVEATRRIRAEHPESQVIVLTTFDDDEDVFEALRAGAAGYLLKGASGKELTEAIRAVARGDSFLQPSIAAKVVTEFKRLSPARCGTDRQHLKEALSEREVEVLRQLAGGKSNKEIGVELNLAEGTVKNHLSNIFGKLGVLDRTQAALLAREMGLL